MSNISGLSSFMTNRISGLYNKNTAGKNAGKAAGKDNSFSKSLDEAAVYDKGASYKTDNIDNYTYDSMRVSSKRSEAKSDQPELSDNAKKLLEELKEKYKNMDFFVQSYSSDEEAQQIMSQGTKEYSVLMDPATLEKMAADAETKEKYMGIIDDSTQKLAGIKEQLQEEGHSVDNIGITVDTEGTVKFFAKIRESNDRYQEQMKERREAAAKEEKIKEDRAEKEEARKEIQDKLIEKARTATIYADSAEDLLDQIRNFDWTKLLAEEPAEV